MAGPPQLTSAGRTLLTLASFIIVVAGMKAAEAILVPFLLSIFIAFISGPPLFWLQRRGLPAPLAMLIVIGVIAVAGLLLAGLVGSSVNDFVRRVPEYQQRVSDSFVKLVVFAQGHGIEISRDTLYTFVDPGKGVRMLGSALSSLGGVLTNGVLILFTVVFILFEAAGFPAKLKLAMRQHGHGYAPYQRFVDNLQRYLVIKTVVSVITAFIVTIWVWLLGLDYPLLWGVLMFLFNYVPNIGPLIAGIPPVLLALVQLGPLAAGGVALAFVVANTLMGSIIEPRYMGRELGMSTLVVFLSLIFWGWVLGPVGMLLSVPLTMAVKIALDSNDETRWIGTLLGPDVGQPEQESAASAAEGPQA